MTSANSNPNPNPDPNPNPNPANAVPIDNSGPVVALNTQNSTKLIGRNYHVWKVQMTALLVSYDLYRFVDGSSTCPSPFHRNYNYWKCQDQLTLHAIITSVDQQVISLLGNAKNSKDAWDILNKAFAAKTRHCIMHLKECLSRSVKGSKPVVEFLQGIKTIADELAVINSTVDDIDFVIHTLNGHGSDFKEVAAALCTRETPMSFDELHDILIDFEAYL